MADSEITQLREILIPLDNLGDSDTQRNGVSYITVFHTIFIGDIFDVTSSAISISDRVASTFISQRVSNLPFRYE